DLFADSVGKQAFLDDVEVLEHQPAVFFNPAYIHIVFLQFHLPAHEQFDFHTVHVFDEAEYPSCDRRIFGMDVDDPSPVKMTEVPVHLDQCRKFTFHTARIHFDPCQFMFHVRSKSHAITPLTIISFPVPQSADFLQGDIIAFLCKHFVVVSHCTLIINMDQPVIRYDPDTHLFKSPAVAVHDSHAVPVIVI